MPRGTRTHSCRCSATRCSFSRATSRNTSQTRVTTQLQRTTCEWWRCGAALLAPDTAALACPLLGPPHHPGRAAGSVQDAARRLRVPAYYQGAPRPGLKQTAHARCSRPLNRRAPRLQVSQFFGGGFAQVKVSFVCDVIRLCKSKHQTLWKQQKDARIKVETNGYRPNARLQAKKPPAPAAAVPKKPSPKRR